MSALSEQDRLNPNHPLYYAPRSLRERSAPRLSSPNEAIATETITEPLARPAFSPSPFDTQLENAVSEALRQQLTPQVFHEAPALMRTPERRSTLTGGAKYAAAAGISAVVAVLFVVVLPRSWQPDAGSSSPSGTAQSIRTALPQPGPTSASNATKSSLAEFQAILAPSAASQLAPSASSQPVTHEQSEELLRAFVQWREKPTTESADK